MSWREILGVVPATETFYTQNPHKVQKHAAPGNCADIADSAYGDSEEDNSKLLEALTDICQGVDIIPADVKDALAKEDIEDWHKGEISHDALEAFARSLAQRREMDKGEHPASYTEHATCKQCGPIWLWFSGEVQGCPWCWNRVAGKPIPRPCSVQCDNCFHFERTDHPNLGHCVKGNPEAAAGLWGSDWRYCECFLPRPKRTNNGHPNPARTEQ